MTFFGLVFDESLASSGGCDVAVSHPDLDSAVGRLSLEGCSEDGVLVRRILSAGVWGENTGTLFTRRIPGLAGTPLGGGGAATAAFAAADAASCWRACSQPTRAFSRAAESVPGMVEASLAAPAAIMY